MKSRFFASLMLLFLGLSALAQTVRVTGTVVDNVGPVVGASVVEKGTSNGAVNDLDGHYAISVRRGAVLQFSSIGYATQEVTVGDRNVIDITLAEDSEFLDEVVVVGYGTMKRSDLSGASVSMREEDLK